MNQLATGVPLRPSTPQPSGCVSGICPFALKVVTTGAWIRSASDAIGSMPIAAACEPLGLRAQRVRDVVGHYKTTDKIEQMTRGARYVGDLTHERPNVYFELGYARGIGRTVITIARKDTEVHFDVKDWTYCPMKTLVHLRRPFGYISRS